MNDIKSSIDYISKPLTDIINLSLNESISPGQRKIVRVIPVFKTGDKTEIRNYRPISLIPAFIKRI